MKRPHDTAEDTDNEPKTVEFEIVESNEDNNNTSESKGTPKKQKTVKAPVGRKNDDGDTYLELEPGKKKRLTVRAWQNNVLIDIREYYQDKDKKMLPGKKGISLNPAQFRFILEHADEISKTIAALSSTANSSSSSKAD
ncbi:hypothetical protein BGZ94_009606 [Podila epigama]|nr:hypothetical protein BGZ94_009606 [Podila epigama]